MGSAAMKNDVLQILADNIKNNASPKPVPSETIAWKLNVQMKELTNLLKTMNESGTIISDMDNHYSIITAAGMSCLENGSSSYPGMKISSHQQTYSA